MGLTVLWHTFGRTDYLIPIRGFKRSFSIPVPALVKRVLSVVLAVWDCLFLPAVTSVLHTNVTLYYHTSEVD